MGSDSDPGTWAFPSPLPSPPQQHFYSSLRLAACPAFRPPRAPLADRRECRRRGLQPWAPQASAAPQERRLRPPWYHSRLHQQIQPSLPLLYVSSKDLGMQLTFRRRVGHLGSLLLIGRVRSLLLRSGRSNRLGRCSFSLRLGLCALVLLRHGLGCCRRDRRKAAIRGWR